MTILRPPPTHPQTDTAPSPEVLFKEARRRRRRRWTVGVVVLALAGAIAWAGYSLSGNGGAGPHPSSVSPTSTHGAPLARTSHDTVAVAPGSPGRLEHIAFFSPTDGYGLFTESPGGFCETAVAETTNGGATFSVPVPVAPCGAFPSSAAQVAFDDHGDGFVYGSSLFVTHDGAKSWQPDPQPGAILSVEALGESIWMLEAMCPDSVTLTLRQTCPLRVYESTDGGRSWVQSPSQPPSAAVTGEARYLWGTLVRVSTTQAYVLGSPVTSSLQRTETPGTVPLDLTTDGGRSWTQETLTCGADAERAILSAAPSGTLFAICGGQEGAGQQGKAVFVSTDGGASWSERATCPEPETAPPCALGGGYVGVVDAVSSSTAYLADERGHVLVSSDGGAQWAAQEPTGTSMYVAFFNSSDGVSLTSSTNVWHTTDGGQTWSETKVSVHAAALPQLRKGRVDAATVPAPIASAVSAIEKKTSVPFEVPLTLPPALSAEAKVSKDRYSVSLHECPSVLRFDTPAIGTKSCGGTDTSFGVFGGVRETSAASARAVLADTAKASPPGCQRGRKVVSPANIGGIEGTTVSSGSSVCEFSWKAGRWTFEVTGAATTGTVDTVTANLPQTLAHPSVLPGSRGLLVFDTIADHKEVKAFWQRGATLYEASAHGDTPSLLLSLARDMVPVSSR